MSLRPALENRIARDTDQIEPVTKWGRWDRIDDDGPSSRSVIKTEIQKPSWPSQWTFEARRRRN